MQLYLLLTQSCNLKCPFCIRGNSKENDFLDINDLKVVLSQNDFKHYYIFLTGGEPTLHPDLPNIIELCQTHFKGVAVNTNGLLSSWISKCSNTDFHVQVSIDGYEEQHSKIRGMADKDLFKSVMRTIQELYKRQISYNVSTTVGKENYDDVRNLCFLMDSFPGLKYWKVSPRLPFGCADFSDTITIQEWNSLVDYLLENSTVRLSIKRLFDFAVLDKYMMANHDNTVSTKSNCGDVKYKIYVYPDFTIYPCTCLTDFPLGNLHEERLASILNNDRSEVFRNYHVKAESNCSDCKYLGFCNGGCIGMSYHYYGELGMGDYRCPLKKLDEHPTIR